MARIGVIYLCRLAEGQHPVRAFVDSYRAHAAGADHDLHVIFKGLGGSSLAAARALFGELPLHAIEIDDKGYDIGSYFTAAQFVANRRLIFFNTFTELLADNWLKSFDDALSLPDVGLVGATGSWQSPRSMYQASWKQALYWIGHPLEYLRRPDAHRLPIRDSRKAQDATAPASATERYDGRSALGQIGRTLYRLIRFDRNLLPYAPFPNPHIRTNAFMVERDRFLALRFPSLRTKFDVYRFESGVDSLTNQIVALGLKAVVVDRKGNVYEVADWKASSTYWIDDQKNLIAADNRTRDYSGGTPFDRARLRAHAWEVPEPWMADQHE